MEKYEWKSTIRINILTLRLMGLWPKISKVDKFNFYTLYTLIQIYIFLYGSIFFQIMYVILVRTDLEEFTKLLFVLWTKSMCDLLCDNLRNLGMENFNEKLLVCIRHHKLVVSFAESTNKFFNTIVLAQFFSTVVNFAMGMFRLSMVSPASNEGFNHLFYVSALTVQLSLYCWFGNEVDFKKVSFDL
ncbi:7tm 6 domain containing protein [Asbolus verrucosus]|uniref:7tm 6 domain containing protein n=1 Tax=Asbolus verrucosus TaxID=1661398 RepID=A0A482VX68_ASBVE|nr:7tm 6 domain containing protein [Asbolus verrucosus]